jgi:extradiol dioxygenase family protein
MIPLFLTFVFISRLDDYWFITLLDDNIVVKHFGVIIWLDDNIAMSQRCYDLIRG